MDNQEDGGPVVVTADHATAFIGTHFGGAAAALASVGRGEWSQAFAFSPAGRDYIIRFSALGEDFAKDRLAARYGSRDLPIPAIIELGATSDGYYAISERVVGGYLDEADEPQMRALLPSLFGSLDAMRLADISPSVGYGVWKADGNAPHATWPEALLDVVHDRPEDRIRGWRERLAA
jgi:hygromycin-B 4-O-kinase